MDAIAPINRDEAHNDITDEVAALEATELRTYQPDLRVCSSAIESTSARFSQPPANKPYCSSSVLVSYIFFPMHKFWTHQVVITVPHDTCRDHLGAYMHISSRIKLRCFSL